MIKRISTIVAACVFAGGSAMLLSACSGEGGLDAEIPEEASRREPPKEKVPAPTIEGMGKSSGNVDPSNR